MSLICPAASWICGRNVEPVITEPSIHPQSVDGPVRHRGPFVHAPTTSVNAAPPNGYARPSTRSTPLLR